MLLTRLPLDLKEASFLLLSFDLHVLSTPPAFVLSQDQTLHDRSFVWLDYFLPCSNSLLGIATSHIGLIRSLYCSVFKEPSLFKRLNYLTTFVEVCQMIFLKSFSSLFRTGPLHQRRVLSYHTAFFVSTAFFHVFLIGRLTGTACPPQAKKISRSVLCDDGKHASQNRLVIEMNV